MEKPAIRSLALHIDYGASMICKEQQRTADGPKCMPVLKKDFLNPLFLKTGSSAPSE
jgi:hypothetical protein